MTIHETVRRARRRARRGAGGIPDRRRTTTPAPCSIARRRGRRRPARRRARRPEPGVRAAAGGRCHLRREDRRRRPGARPRPAARRSSSAACAHCRRTSARGRARDGRSTVWRARVGEDGLVRARRGPARRRPAHGRCARGCAGSDDAASRRPRRRSRCCAASSRTDAYADRALRGAAAELDERDRALAQQLAYGTVQRVADARPRDRDARAAARPQARPACACRAPARRVPARLPRRRPALRSRQRVGRARRGARLERAVPFANAVLRRLADGIGQLLDGAAGVDAARGGAPSLVSRLGGRDVVARPRPRTTRSR